MSVRTLYLERPSFWTEERDPECWLRGLKVLRKPESEEGIIRGAPFSIWQRHLKQAMSRRSILGLFGMAQGREENFLLGVGFLEYHPDKKGWKLAAFTKSLVAESPEIRPEGREVFKRLGVAGSCHPVASRCAVATRADCPEAV